MLGMSSIPVYISVQTEDFDVNAQMQQLRQANAAIGAITAFIGLVRDLNEGSKISAMTLEHYAGMTEKSLADIAEQARNRWSLQGITIIHRVGELNPSEQIVLVLTASAHRHAAFTSAEFIMDYLKSQAPFWKKETTPNGAHWVDARESDETALKRWQS
jgi:molybdopterin synthase catalytic subunit